MPAADAPLGVFDSGLGGLTVVRALRHRLPSESIVYLGDTARVPYGTRSPETVVKYALSCSRVLIERGVKAIVVACNTVSAVALTDSAEGSFGGIAAFYSIIHIPRPSLVSALREMKRALRPGGRLLLTFHLGQRDLHIAEWWNKPVSLDFYFFETIEMKDYLAQAGFELEEVIERDPYPDIEVQTRRAYIFARKP